MNEALIAGCASYQAFSRYLVGSDLYLLPRSRTELENVLCVPSAPPPALCRKTVNSLARTQAMVATRAIARPSETYYRLYGCFASPRDWLARPSEGLAPGLAMHRDVFACLARGFCISPSRDIA